MALARTIRGNGDLGRRWRGIVACRLALAVALVFGRPSPLRAAAESGSSSATLTNALQVRQLVAAQEAANRPVRLEGIVLWTSPERDRLILQDHTGGIVVKMDFTSLPAVTTGQKVMLEGTALVRRDGIAAGALVENDGIHATIEQSGRMYLTAGRHPLTMEWFNSRGDAALEVDYSGPGIPRQRLTDTVLYTSEETDTNGLVHGLNYRDYEGDWNRLPEFSRLKLVKSGIVTNLDLQVRSRSFDVALLLSGYFDAPTTGEYRFWLRSDDGSRLFMDRHTFDLTVRGRGEIPTPRVIQSGQVLADEQECQWAEMEGFVTGIREVDGIAWLELISGTGRAYLNVSKVDYDSLNLLLHSRIKGTGAAQNMGTADGQTLPSLWVPDATGIAITEMNAAHWADASLQPISSLLATNFSPPTRTMVRVSGIARSDLENKLLIIEDDTGRISVEVAQSRPRIGERVEALGWWSREEGRVILRGGCYREISPATTETVEGSTVLTRAIEVKGLSRAEAKRGYPVKIQGVITARIGNDFVIQDSTWSIYSYWYGIAGQLPKIGEYWEIEGVSSVDFAPNIEVRRASYLKPGMIPEPIRPTRDELLNGSLDTQYIELQGIATAVESNRLTLLTRDDRVKLQIRDPHLESMATLEGALIRIRGVSTPVRDANKMIVPSVQSRLYLFNTSVTVVEPAPADLFDLPLKHVSDLLFFDARADSIRRVKVSGQIIHEREDEAFLMDGTNGMRFETEVPVKLQPGDLVEVVGFPNMSGPSPVLREARVKVFGKSKLPSPHRLAGEAIISGKLDATLVSLESRLINLNVNRTEQTLELQAGSRSYVAHLANNLGALPAILPGSLLELTGVYAGQGGDRSASRDIDSFQLFLNSPNDVLVLARPAWWSLRHTLAVVSGMLVVILGAMVWITLLRRQVEERSLQLTTEINSREQAERQRALEAERSRIAQDLHDELGATLTEIRFLSAVKSRDALVPTGTRQQLTQISEKARQTVSSLDEIVWAVNPTKDSLPSLASYLRYVAEEFFRNTEVRCRMDMDQILPPTPLTSEVRHNLYLAVREALNNIAKHAQATEAWLRMHWQDGTLQIVIEDNGRGFADLSDSPVGNGVRNMRWRVEKIGGRFECHSAPGTGTVCRIFLSLN